MLTSFWCDLCQVLVANIDYDDFKGKLGVGRVHSGNLKRGQTVGLGRPGEDVKVGKIAELFVFDNLGRMVCYISETAGLTQVRCALLKRRIHYELEKI